MRAAVESGSLPGLHGLVASQHGRAVLELYFEGIDERIGHAPGLVRFGPDVLHDLRSVTKSIVGLLCGIVVTQNDIDLERPLPELLPRWRAHFNAATSALTLRHVLTMSMGLAWDESISYADARNSEIQMALSPDRVAYVLSRPSSGPAGERWHYCGGATELLAAVSACTYCRRSMPAWPSARATTTTGSSRGQVLREYVLPLLAADA